MKLFFLILIFLSSCNVTNVPLTYKPSAKQKLVNQIRNVAAHRIQEKTGLVPCGTGAQMMDEIKMIALSFNYYKPITQNAGRQLLITATEELLNEINQNKQVRKYLYRYPFQPQNIEIRIFIYNEDRSSIKPGNICYLSALDGILYYELREVGKFKSSTLAEETYLQALEKAHKLRFTFQ